ncbi:hypothetical protein K501DRAFT_33354 [Backusella circina FSU 941]|nr:hypothetical protein K501DRAFT_33354 [Backusella circina FSU 941]
MADFICLAMAPQYTTDQQQNGSENTSSFRRSLNSNLFGRRSMNSRSNNNSVMDSQQESVHVRIVPHIDNPSRSLVFSIIDRDLEAGHVVRVGRFTDRIATQNHISFKSKVVSRTHCEIWLNNNGKILIKDTKSSSGTFINHIRLSPTNQESRAVEVRDGDIVQLGVDYQGGLEEIYRAVKMKFEINRPTQDTRPISYSMSAYNNLRNLTSLSYNRQTAATMELDHSSDSDEEAEHSKEHVTQKNTMCHSNEIEVEECCICLYALAPFQALFVAPCSHSYHFKCIRPLFDSYPGFQCPICRTYSDLDASVAVETEEVMEKFGLYSGKRNTADKPSYGCEKKAIDKNILQSNTSNDENGEREISCSSNSMMRQRSQQQQSSSFSSEPPLSMTLVACNTNFSGVHPTEIQSHPLPASRTECK